MVTILISILFLGSFLSYSTSSKVTLSTNSNLDRILNKPFSYKKQIGFVIIFFTSFFFIREFGTTSGFLFWIFTLTTILSLLICVYPLQIIKTRSILLIILIAIIIEFLLNYAS